MESFGRATLKYGNCRVLVVCSVMLILLQQAESLVLAARVERRPTGKNVQLANSNDYFVFPGDNLRIYCYCSNSTESEVRMMSLRLKDRPVNSTSGCVQITHPLHNTSQSDTGTYQCVSELTNGTIRRTEAGNLGIVDPSIIQVPDVQYGLLNSNTTLNCTVNYTQSSIMWEDPNFDTFGGKFVGVNLQHEGRYRCVVYLSSIDLVMNKPVQFTVIVPPTIISHPNSTHIVRNEPKNFTIHFQSKNSDETSVSWYRNGRSLQNSITVLDAAGNGLTEMIFNPIRRSDSGEYLVVIENSHGIIPSNQRRVEAHFTVMVSILPAEPAELNVHGISDKTATLSWSVTPNNNDESALNQTITVYYRNGTVAYQRVVGGTVRQEQLVLIPGEMYFTTVMARNQDGYTVSQNWPFQTLTGAPLVSAVEVKRTEHNNTLSLKVSLAYTGGGSIRYFAVAFRHPEVATWTALGNFIASATDSMLVWTTQVVEERFQGSRIELRVEAVNSNGHVSNRVVQLEEIALPGAPEQVSFVSSDYDSVLLRVVLPTVGTAPLIGVEVEFYSPDHSDALNVTVPSINFGSTVDVTISDLQDGTEYIISLAVYNYGGKGTPSRPIKASTSTRPPLPVFGIALVAVGGTFLIVAMVIIIVVIKKKYSNVKKRKRAYSFAEAESSKFPSDHAIVKTGKRSPLSPTSPPSPPTPSTATSVLTPRPSPPGFYPTPPYCSASTSYLPSAPTNMASAPTNTNPSSFKFDAGSSRSNSVKGDSELSDSNSPRYTYTFPRSGEGTPQIGRAYDEVDLPLDLKHQLPLPPLISNGGILNLRAHHVSHGCIRSNAAIRSNESRVRMGSASGSHKVGSDTNSPHLRTQSTHSVAATHTRLASSDSTSTRDGLSYPPIQANNTNV